MSSFPTYAESREAGVVCPHCSVEIRYGDPIRRCEDCGQIHHDACMLDAGGCGAYTCAPARRAANVPDESVMKISSQELEDVVPLPTVRRPLGATFATPGDLDGTTGSGTNRLAVASLIIAVVGIPLFGVVTGLVAIVVGSIAISNRERFARGTGFAVSGLLLGVADVVGWLIFLTFMLNRGGPPLNIANFEPDPAALESVEPHIRRAMKANVLIQSDGGFSFVSGASIGSGVILRIRDGEALIVTNRHVIDGSFAAGGAGDAGNQTQVGDITVKMIGQLVQPGKVVWIAPDGIDLALLTAAVPGEAAEAAPWKLERKLAIGEKVSAIGNPHGLGWTHTTGDISQFRTQQNGNYTIRVIQTSTAINPGNSGGGLYDKDGTLIGINTWTNDKRFSEGLSFSIDFKTLLDLNPPQLELEEEQEDE